MAKKDVLSRYICVNERWQYIEANEAAPGRRGDQYSRVGFTEDWAEAVAYTVYPQYGQTVGICQYWKKEKPMLRFGCR
jgi:hypothetical protein